MIEGGKQMPAFYKYGLKWDSDTTDDLQVEMFMLKRGGQWTQGGITYGHGNVYHYEQMRCIIWPELDGSHNGQRWHTLCLKEIRRPNAKVTVLMGAGSSGKTHEAAWNYLCEYMVFPEETLVLVSSTDMRGLELRVWGEIKMLHTKAKDRFDYLPGHLIDSKHCICTDDVEEDEARDLRKGVVGIPTVQNGKQIGLGKWIGVKQKRLRLIADEAQYCGSSFLSAFANLDKNEDFQAIVLGNPNDPSDPLGKAAEPKDGWATHMEPEKTDVWDTRFLNGRCVNLIGTDSPNWDFEGPTRFRYLISKEKIENTLSFFPKDSIEYYSQCVGAMKIGVLARRVLTNDLCKQYQAQEKVIWRGGDTHTHIYFVDSSYGGDRCVAGGAEIGTDINGKQILSFWEPHIIPILVGTGKEPEYQIAEFVKEDCESLNVPPENMGHDSTGRGSLGTALAQVWSNQTNPIESGGRPTERPVSLDVYTVDDRTKERRLKTCSEHYDRKVTEFWWSVRYAVESGQIRNLPEEAKEELCARRWDRIKGDKISVEIKNGTSTKPGMKQRTGKSPDMGDWAAGIVEMARRRGFQISKLGELVKKSNKPDWLAVQTKDWAELQRKRQLEMA